MQLTFYNCSSPTNKVTKVLGTALTPVYNIDPNGDLNRIDPVFVLDGLSSVQVANLANANYVVAGDPFNRSYFIVAADFTIAKTAIITCHVDVLSTYSAKLANTKLNYIRGAGDLTEMEDASYPVSDYMIQQHYAIPNWTDIFSKQGSERQYLLRTAATTSAVANFVNVVDGQLVYIGLCYYDATIDGTRYDCYKLSVNGNKLTGVLYSQTDITGIDTVAEGDFVYANNKCWRTYLSDVNVPYWQYLGDTT